MSTESRSDSASCAPSSNVRLSRAFADGRILFEREGTHFVLTWEDVQEVIKIAKRCRDVQGIPPDETAACNVRPHDFCSAGTCEVCVDAAKWRALVNCDRLTAVGSAGCGIGDDEPYAHLTLNFWTGLPRKEAREPSTMRWLDKFITKALRRSNEPSSAHVHVWDRDGIYDGAVCRCGVRADSWYCPDSPDHLCHYNKGDLDSCDYCGQPEERK